MLDKTVYCQRCGRDAYKRTIKSAGWSKIKIRIKHNGSTKKLLCERCTKRLIVFINYYDA